VVSPASLPISYLRAITSLVNLTWDITLAGQFLKPTPPRGLHCLLRLQRQRSSNLWSPPPPCSEEVRKEGTGDDAGHAEEKEHAPQEGARQTEADAAELAC
jgi:hypothetical protein